MDSRISSNPRPAQLELALDQADRLELWELSRDSVLAHWAETELSLVALDSKQLECRDRQDTEDNQRDRAVG